MIYWIVPLVLFATLSFYLIASNSSLFFREKSRKLPIVDSEPFNPLASPIELKKNQSKAILFVHGFPSSPATYQHTAKEAFKNGYDVYVPKLPGFASDPNIFTKTRFTDWFDYLINYYKTIRPQYDQFYVVGTSMGGAMTLKIAEVTSGTDLVPTAIATLAAPVFLNKPSKGIVKQPLTPLLKPVSLFTKALNPSLKSPIDEDLDGMENWIGYHGVFPKQLHSMIQNLKVISKNLPKITLPVYMIHDRNDKTVPFANMYFIANKIGSADVVTESLKLEGLKSNRHCLLLYTSIRDELFDRIDAFFKSRENETAKAIDRFETANIKNKKTGVENDS